jgi:hypothetical protein
MKLVEMNWTPGDRQLRQFGCVALLALPLVGWLWKAGSLGIAILAALGVVLAALGWRRPQWLRPIFIGLSLVTFPIGWLVSELTLLLLFYGVFLPLGFVMRAVGYDPLDRSFKPAADSYWQPKKRPTEAASYFRRW